MHETLHAPGPARGIHQPTVGGAVHVLDVEARGDARLARIVRRGPSGFLFFSIQPQLHIQHLFAATTEHRQRAVRRDSVDGFEIIEKVGVLLRRVVLAFQHLGLHHAMLLHVLAQRLQQGRILGEALHQNLPRPIQRRLGIDHTGIGIARRTAERFTQILRPLLFWVQRRVRQQRIRQRLQPSLQRDLRLGAALRLVGQIQIFEVCLVRRQRHCLQQLRRHLALLGDGRDDGRTAIFQLAQITQPLLQQTQLNIVQPARRLFAITRDERHGRALVQQGDGSRDLSGFGRNLGGKALFDGWEHIEFG